MFWNETVWNYVKTNRQNNVYESNKYELTIFSKFHFLNCLLESLVRMKKFQ